MEHVDAEGNLITVYESQLAAAEALGDLQTSISMVIRGVWETTKLGHRFRQQSTSSLAPEEQPEEQPEAEASAGTRPALGLVDVEETVGGGAKAGWVRCGGGTPAAAMGEVGAGAGAPPEAPLSFAAASFS